MPKLWLFGAELNLTDNGASFHFSGSLNNPAHGPYANSVEATLTKDEQGGPGTLLDLKFSGDLPFGFADFQTKLDCQVGEDDRVHLLNINLGGSATAKSVKIKLPSLFFVPELILGSPSIKVGTKFDLDVEGVAFDDSRITLRDGLLSVPLNAALVTSDWSRAQLWSSYHVSFNFTVPPLANFDDPHVLFKPNPTGANQEIIFKDRFLEKQPIPKDRRRREQFLSIKVVRATASEIRVFAYPSDHALLIHPDILNTQNAASAENDILYQHALVNGFLEIVYQSNAPGAMPRVRWQKAIDGEPGEAAMIAFRLSDEHGNPLVIKANYFPLASRKGVDTEVKVGDTPDHWESTIRGVVVHAVSDEEKQVLKLLRLTALDPVYLSPDNSSHEFYWLVEGGHPKLGKKGKGVVAGTAPAEIHGLSKGLYLEWTNPQASPPQIECQLETIPIVTANGHIYTQTDMLLKVGNWAVRNQLEERETYPANHYVNVNKPEKTVAMRKAEVEANKGEQLLRLPLIDTIYALSNMVGEGRLETTLAKSTLNWTNRINNQFTNARAELAQGQSDEPLFQNPYTKMQTHITGLALNPPPIGHERFYTVIDYPRAEAKTIRDTARTAANLVSAVNSYVHGGERDTSGTFYNKLEGELKNQLTESFKQYANEFEVFWNKIWNDADKNIRDARDALRDFLSPRPLNLPPGSEVFFADTLAKAKELVHGAKAIPGIGTEFTNLKDFIPVDMTVAQFIVIWSTNPAILLRKALLDYLWLPGSIAAYRRALEAVYPQFVQDGAQLAAELQAHKDVLLAQVKNFVNTALPVEEQIKQWKGYLENGVPGVLTKARHGIDDMYRKLIAVWEEGVEKWADDHNEDLRLKGIWVDLRKRYSPIFSPDVYAKLLLQSEDARKVIELYNAAKGIPPLDKLLNKLKDLKVEPPAYFFYTQRFPVEQAADSPDMELLWRRPFDLCRIASDKFWNFLLDKESSVIVKMTGVRGIADIIGELHNNYRSESRKNPLGLVVTDDKKDFVADFISHLHPDILAPHWRGILIINPMADIANDEQLSTLCGFRYIGARYVAIGGSKLEAEDSNLDVYANIFKQSSSQEADGSTDVALTVVKFDVSIKHTHLESGEVVLRLDLQNLWGRSKKDLEGTPDDFKEIYIRGSLPREEKTNGEKQAPSSFEFAAWLPKPYKVKINLAFIEAFEFKALRVGKNKGQTSIEIDGDILLKSWDSPIGGQKVPVNQDGQEDDRIALNNFRILVPKLPPGKSLPMGMHRLLNFEFPAVSLNLRRPRSFNLWGMEITPHGLGFIRNQTGGDAGPLKQMHDEYVWLADIKWPDLTAPGFVFSFVKCDVEFGQLPVFGGTGASQLRFEMLMGVFIESGQAPRIAVGLSGLEARDLRLNIFGLLKLEIERLLIGSFQAQLPNHSEQPQTVTAISAEDVRVTILDWSVLPPGSRLELLFMHETKPENHRGVLGWYWQEVPDEKSFFRLHWVLLGKGIDPGNDVMNHLLAPTPTGDGSKLLEKMVDTKSSPKTIKARVTSDGNWLFGASFGLGEIITQGSFIIHDQHYYGVALTAPWLTPLIGSDSLMLAYMPGATRSQDRFRVSFRLPAFDMLGNFRSGDIALEWAFNWDYLIDIGFPWKGSAGYQWERAFSVPSGTYEAKFGLYIEKRSQNLPATIGQRLTIAAGAGLYVGYYFGFQSPVVWLHAGIGVFAILEGSITFDLSIGPGFKAAIVEIMVRGVIGIYAYGEGGIDQWVLSARFRVSVQAAESGELHYLPNGGSSLSYGATLSASYSASVRVGTGFFSFTFSVSGSVEIGVSGRVLLN